VLNKFGGRIQKKKKKKGKRITSDFYKQFTNYLHTKRTKNNNEKPILIGGVKIYIN